MSVRKGSCSASGCWTSQHMLSEETIVQSSEKKEDSER